VGFKYIGQLIREDKIALGGEESAWLTIRGISRKKTASWHACWLPKCSRHAAHPSRNRFNNSSRKSGTNSGRCAKNLHLSDEQKANAVKKVAVDASTLVGRKVVSIDRTDGAKFVFDDGTWMLLRLSGTERCSDCTLKADSAAASARLAREATEWVLKGLKHPLKRAEPKSGFGVFLERHGRTILGLFVLALVVHDVFGPHGYIAMRRTQGEIDRVRKDLDRLNKKSGTGRSGSRAENRSAVD